MSDIHWRKLSEELPPLAIPILCRCLDYGEARCFVGYYDGSNRIGRVHFFIWPYVDNNIIEVTHWAYINNPE